MGTGSEDRKPAAPPPAAIPDSPGLEEATLNFRFAVSRKTIQTVLALAQEWARGRGVAAEDLGSLRLVLEELLLNISFHAEPASPEDFSPTPGEVRAELFLALYPFAPGVAPPEGAFAPAGAPYADRTPPWPQGRHLFLQLRDSGRAFNPLEYAAEPLGASPSKTTRGGRGLSLVRLLAVCPVHQRLERKNILSLFLPLGEGVSPRPQADGRPKGENGRRLRSPLSLKGLWRRSLALRQAVFLGLTAVALCGAALALCVEAVHSERKYSVWIHGRQAMHSLDLLTSHMFLRLQDDVRLAARILGGRRTATEQAGGVGLEGILSLLLYPPAGAVVYADYARPEQWLLARREGILSLRPLLQEIPPRIPRPEDPPWQGPVLLPLHLSLPSRTAMLFCLPWADPDSESSGLVGVLLFMADLENLFKTLSSLPGAEPFLMNAAGDYVLLSSRAGGDFSPANIFFVSELSGDAALEEIGRAMLAGRTGSRTLTEEAGRVMLRSGSLEGPLTVLYRPMRIPDWRLGLLLPPQSLGVSDPSLPVALILLAAAGCLLFAFLVWRAASRTLQPLKDLAVALEAMANGNLDTPLPAPGRPDEIGAMLLSFEKARLTLRTTLRNLLLSARDRNRLEGEFLLARSIQQSMLPVRFAVLPRTEVFAHIDMAGQVCGDFYDSFPLDGGRLCCVVGDVSGTGIPAAILMNGVVSLTREALLEDLNPAGTLARVNDALLRTFAAAMFVTMLVGILEEESGIFAWAAAGHPAPLLARPAPEGAGQVFSHPWPGELALGIRAQEGYSLFSRRLLSGESLLLYSDGAEEALGPSRGGREEGEFFGAERLAASLARHITAPSAAAHLGGVRADLLAHMKGGPPHDDITLMLLRRR